MEKIEGKLSPDNQIEQEPEHYLLQLANCEIPFHDILQELNIVDQVNFASTNTKMKRAVFENSQIMRKIKDNSCFDLDLFPNIPIKQEEIDALHRTFTNLNHLRVSLSRVNDNFLDSLRKFKYLEKLSVYVNARDIIYNQNGVYLNELSIKALYNTSETDVIHSLIRQIHGTQQISIWNGNVSVRTVDVLERRRLRKLKVHNSVIKNCFYFIRYLLSCRSLTHVRITSDNYIVNPYPIYITSDIISQLDNFRNLNWEYFSFTIDANIFVRYECLRYLKKLRKLDIYFCVQERTTNLEKLIYLVGSMKYVETTFIEYFNDTLITNREQFEACERKSYCYRSIILSLDKYIEIKSLNYDMIRLRPEYSFLE